MATEIGEVVYKVRLSKNKFKKDLKASGKMITQWGNRIGNVMAGVLGVSMFGQALKSWKDFQASFRQVNALQEGKANLKEIKEMAHDISKTFGTEASESVNAFYQSVSAGFDPKKSLDLTKEAAILSSRATASGQQISQVGAIDALTTVLNAFDLSADQASRASDALAKGVDVGKTSINEIAGSLSRVAPIAAAFGMQIEDVIATMSALTLNGAQTAEAITGMRGAISEMAKSSTDAGKALQTNLGMSFQEAVQSGMSFKDILKEGILPAVKGNTAEIINLFGNVRASASVISLAKNNFQKLTYTTDAFSKSLGTSRKGLQDFIDNPLTRWNAGVQETKMRLMGLIDTVGGLTGAISKLSIAFAAVKVIGLILKLKMLSLAYMKLAVAKTAAQTAAAAPAALAALTAAVSTAAIAGGAIFTAVRMNQTFGKKGRTLNMSQNNQKQIKNNFDVKVNVTPTGTSALVNGQRVNAQSNYGGG